ncbi:MAG: hypothetical protein CL608_24840 [Anaerolineaceae bacterium]|nr:hypothetical protein [Anaerolineaceae bacterium]
MQKLKALVNESSTNGSIEVREYSEKLSFSLIGTDPYQPNGRLQIRLYLPIWKNENVPKFELFRDRDEYWTKFFLKQFAEIWKISRPLYSNSDQLQTDREERQLP